MRGIRLLLVRSLLRTRQSVEARQILVDILAHESDSEASWLLSRSYIQQRDWNRAASLLNPGTPYHAENAIEFEPAPYVGAASCASCHPKIFKSLLASKHATTFSRARDLNKLELPVTPVADPGNPQVTHDFTRRINRSGSRLVLAMRFNAR